MCGGILSFLLIVAIAAGLSPRVRRHRLDPGGAGLACRAISACAESSDRLRVFVQRRGVYLRGCGGIGADVIGYNVVHGLSPHVRSHLAISSAV